MTRTTHFRPSPTAHSGVIELRFTVSQVKYIDAKPFVANDDIYSVRFPAEVLSTYVELRHGDVIA